MKHYFLQFDLPQYSNCSYGDNVQVNIKPKCLTLLRPLNIKRLDILTYPIIKPQHQVVEENVTEPVLATLCGAAPIPTVDTFGSSARCHPASSTTPPLLTHTSCPTRLPNFQSLFKNHSSLNSHIQHSGSYSTLMGRIKKRRGFLSRSMPVWRVRAS